MSWFEENQYLCWIDTLYRILVWLFGRKESFCTDTPSAARWCNSLMRIYAETTPPHSTRVFWFEENLCCIGTPQDTLVKWFGRESGWIGVFRDKDTYMTSKGHPTPAAKNSTFRLEHTPKVCISQFQFEHTTSHAPEMNPRREQKQLVHFVANNSFLPENVYIVPEKM